MAERPRFWRRHTPGGATVRWFLWPVSVLYGLVMRGRNWAFDRGFRATVAPGCPTVSVGNVSVGGTGKTPVAAWFAARLASRGVRPGIVLRGYGSDEALVLERLVPGSIVVAGADRVAGVRRAVAEGAEAIVLDDGFQHRRAGRHWDVVLVSADAHDEVDWVLPAGPLREPLQGLRRADLVIITRKAADGAAVAAVEARVRAAAPAVPIAVVALSADALHRWSDRGEAPLGELADRMVAAVSGIGDPEAFERQLNRLGARVTGFRYADHHAYTADDVRDLVSRVPPGGMVVCTLKDAVKLGPLWPDLGPPLWYLSQRITVERGEEMLAAGLDALLASGPPRLDDAVLPPPSSR